MGRLTDAVLAVSVLAMVSAVAWVDWVMMLLQGQF